MRNNDLKVTTGSLTAGNDNLVGTSGNDVFEARGLEQNAMGILVNTLGTGDKINGAGGVNTLKATIINDAIWGGHTAVRPETTNVQNIEVTALTPVINLGDGVAAQPVVLNAQLMSGVQKLHSVNSEATLIVENVFQNGPTQSIEIGMINTGNGGRATTDAGRQAESNLEVYFDERALNSIPAAGTEGIEFHVLDQDAYDALGKNINATEATDALLTGFALGRLSFKVDGEIYDLTLDNPITETPETHAELVDLLNVKLAELVAATPALQGLELEFSVGNRFFETNSAGQPVRSGIAIELKMKAESEDQNRLELLVPAEDGKSVIDFSLSESNNIYRASQDIDLQGPTGQPITSTILLDAVGRGSDGGYLKVGSMSEGSLSSSGVQVFDITVNRSSSVSWMDSTNDALHTVNLKNGSTNGNLIIGNTHGGIDAFGGTGIAANVNYGLVDVQNVNSSLQGNFTLTAALTEEVVDRYLDLVDTQDGPRADNVNFNYNMGNNNSTLNLHVAEEAVVHEDFVLNINLGNGTNTLNLSILDTAGAYADGFTANQGTIGADLWGNNNIHVTGGTGVDTITLAGNGIVTVNSGAGNDVIYTDNTGDKSSVQLNNNGTADVSNGPSYFQLYKHSITVNFLGFEVTLHDAFNQGNKTIYTDLDINQAVKRAINDDPVLSKLLKAEDGEGRMLEIESLIDGTHNAGALEITFTAPAGSGDPAPTDGRNQLTATEEAQIAADNAAHDAATGTAPIATITGANGIQDTYTGADTGVIGMTGGDVSDKDESIVTVNAGAGDNVIVLGTGTAGDTLVLKDTWGTNTVANFNDAANGDVLDFTSYFITADAGQEITATNTAAAGANTVSILTFGAGGFVPEAGGAGDALTFAQFAALGDTALRTVLNGNAAVTTTAEGEAVFMIENNANLGEYLVIATSTNAADAGNDVLTTAKIVGTLDFGDSITHGTVNVADVSEVWF